MKKRFCLHYEPSRQDGRWSYTIRDGGAVVDGVHVERDALTVPQTLNGLPVKSLGMGCFGGMRMYAAWLPDTVERIGAYAFGGCEELRAAVIPASVRCIDADAFDECPELCLYVEEGSYAHRYAELMGLPFAFGMPDVSELPEGSFSCGDFIYSLSAEQEAVIREYTGTARRLVIPAELDGYPVTLLGSYAFSCCGTLEEVVVPECVELIGRYAFSMCENLRRITLPERLTVLGAGCFQQCRALERVRVPDGVDEVCFLTFAECSALQEVVLPDTVEEIDPMAFCGCRSLREIELPAGLLSVAGSSFIGCTQLRMPALPEGLDETSRNAFRNCIGWIGETGPSGGTEPDVP